MIKGILVGLIYIIILLAVMMWFDHAFADEDSDFLAVRAIVGESSNQGYQGMLAVACAIRNRGTLKGVYGVNSKHVDKEPRWVWEQARKAWNESENNRIHSGTNWENIKSFSTPYWVKDMVKVYEYKDHVFYKSNTAVRSHNEPSY